MLRFSCRLPIALMLIVVSSAMTEAQTLTVPGNHPTIAAAVAAAGNGWRILVSAGTYFEHDIDAQGKSLEIRGVDGASQTIIDCQFAGRAFRMHPTTTAPILISGLTIRNGRILSTTPTSSVNFGGGAIIIGTTLTSGLPQATIEDCVFEDNASASNGVALPGGALSIYGNVRVVRCRFGRNGAGYVLGAATGTGLGYGGAIAYDDPSVGGRLVIDDCVFEANRSGPSAEGGALHLEVNSSASEFLIRNSTFRGNRLGAGSSVASGAAIRALLLGGLGRLVGCAFFDNRLGTTFISGPSGAVAVSGHSPLRVEGCTFLSNRSTFVLGAGFQPGGALSFSGSGAHTVTRCALWDSGSPSITTAGTATAAVSHSLVQGGHVGVGNLSSDPRFVDPLQGDVRLLPGSPCIDSGGPGAPATPTDFEGEPRAMGAAIDIGCDEFASVVASYPGTGEDLRLRTISDDACHQALDRILVPEGGSVTVRIESPQGMFASSPYLLGGYAFPTGVSPSQSLFIGVWLPVATFTVLADGVNPTPLGFTPQLGSAGYQAMFQIPPGAAATSVLLQGAALGPASANGVFATTNAHVIDMVPAPVFGSVAGPTLDDSFVSISVVSPGWCPTGLPFYGTSYPGFFVQSNGRVTFGSRSNDPSATLSEALSGPPFVGNWADLNPLVGGTITISADALGKVRIDYANLPYFGIPSSSSTFGIEFDSICGAITLDGLDGISLNVSGTGNLSAQFLGMSPGSLGSATNSGAASFTAASYGTAPTSTAMLYDFNATGVTAGVVGGLTTLVFQPNGNGNYHWYGN